MNETAPTWRDVELRARARLAAAGVEDPEHDARRIVERASGFEGADAVLRGDEPARARPQAHIDAMVARRCAGEPLQYVVGRWAFRSLDLFIDRRVLIPRPETEVVAQHAIDAARALGRPAVVADLGTGSGAIALSLAAELWPHVEVWASDASPDALEVARANLAGLGRRAGVVRLAEGDWFAALPRELRGRFDVIVANPPYVAEADPLPAAVADWEPRGALVSGATGLEAIAVIVAEAPDWLAPAGTLVIEIGDTQGDAVGALADRARLVDIEIRPDLTGRDRMLVARRRG